MFGRVSWPLFPATQGQEHCERGGQLVDVKAACVQTLVNPGCRLKIVTPHISQSLLRL